jgi:hypothetical protein
MWHLGTRGYCYSYWSEEMVYGRLLLSEVIEI